MRKFLVNLINEVLDAKKIKFSQQEIVADGSTRVIGYVNLYNAPAAGSTLTLEKTNAVGTKYFKHYVVDSTTIVVYENGKTEGFIYLKYVGLNYL